MYGMLVDPALFTPPDLCFRVCFYFETMALRKWVFWCITVNSVTCSATLLTLYVVDIKHLTCVISSKVLNRI